MAARICSVDGCTSRCKARGWCSMHYDRWRRTGDTGLADERKRRGVVNSQSCAYCDTQARRRSTVELGVVLCNRHSVRERITGRADTPLVNDYGAKRHVMSTGYVRVWQPDHPLAMADGYVLEHRMVAWDEGILTDPAHHVHHIDHNKANNDPANLEALDEAEHHRHHMAEAGFVENQYGVWPLRNRAAS